MARTGKHRKGRPRQQAVARPVAAAGGGLGRLALLHRRVRPWFGFTLTALLLRILLIVGPLLPGNPLPIFAGRLYPGDHDDFVRWGLQSADRGVLSLYSEPPPRHDWRVWDGQRWIISQRNFDRVCNYPPLSAYLLWLSGTVHKAVSPDRLINTPTSIALFTSWSVLGDFLLAAGCAAIVSLYCRPWAAKLTYGLMVFAPPFWWDSVVWAQMDTVLLAPAVWMLYAMLRERWVLAGVLWGVMFGLKPHAILFIPVWGYALLTVRPFWRPILGGVVAMAVFLGTALPFLLRSGWAWFRLSYYENLFATYSHLVTLKAFNIWYLDVLLTESLDANAKVLGITKGMWGKLFLLAGLLTSLVVTLWRWRQDRRGLVVWTAVCLLLFVMLPTEVHERYLIVALPFVGLVAALTWRIWPGLVLLLVVMMAQLSWPLWLWTKPGQWPEVRANITKDWQAARDRGERVPPLEDILRVYEEQFRQRRWATLPYEWTYTLLSLGGAGLTVGVLLTLRPERGPPLRPAAAPRPQP